MLELHILIDPFKNCFTFGRKYKVHNNFHPNQKRTSIKHILIFKEDHEDL